MTAKAIRPKLGDVITPEMSWRDKAAALGMSTAELWRWTKLAKLPEEVFQRRLKEQLAARHEVTATTLLREAPVPARGRVERAQTIVASMTGDELVAFWVWFAGALSEGLRQRP